MNFQKSALCLLSLKLISVPSVPQAVIICALRTFQSKQAKCDGWSALAAASVLCTDECRTSVDTREPHLGAQYVIFANAYRD